MITNVAIDYRTLFDACGERVEYYNELARACANDNREKAEYYLRKSLYMLMIRTFLMGKMHGYI